MKVQFILAACLVAAAFAAPVENFIDPDCIEEDMVAEEPVAEIEAEFGLVEPELRMDFGAPDSNDECEDEIVTEAPPADDECVDEPIETTPEPEVETEGCVSEIVPTEPQPEPTAAECEEETTAAPADDCAEGDDTAEAEPYIPFQIEPAHVINDEVVLGEQNFFPEVEECEE
jgi:hypothetical protein